jgi:hypothetical protein
MDGIKIMKYYKQNNEVYAYELDGSQDHLIGDKVAMTVEEVEAHLNPPVVVIAPTVITPLQARLALSQIGLRHQIEDSMLTATQDIKDFYEFALEWRRDNAQLMAMATSLGMDSVAIDNFFLLASTL